MRKNILLSLLVSLTLFATAPSAVYIMAKTQAISLDEQKAVYQLPHPGLLPDHPLYFAKGMRDSIMIFFTRDNVKKAELYLLLSDKKAAAALSLAKKGKSQKSLETITESEDLFMKIPPLLKESKEQGVSASNDFIDLLYLSNAKHQEIITEMMKEIPEGDVEQVKDVLGTNTQIRKDLEKLR